MFSKARKADKPGALTPGRETLTGRVSAVTQRGAELGFFASKTGRIGGRVNPELIRLAKERTGVSSDSELLELALTSLVLEDGFADAFRAARGTVPGDVEVGL